MARKKITNKTSRKDDLDPNKDEFITKSISILDWAVERRKHIGVLLLVALLAAVAGIVVNNINETRAVDSTAAIDEGLSNYIAPVITVPDGEEVPSKDDLLYFETREARANEALRLFSETRAKESDSSVGKMAVLGEAGAKFDLGKNDEAIALYEKFLADMDEQTEWLASNAREGLGHSYEAAGKLDDARKTFAELGEKGVGRIGLMGRYHEARVAAKQGDRNKAGELLEEIIKEITEDGEFDRLDYLFVQSRERLLQINPGANVPNIPGGGMDGIDPAFLQQLLQAQQAAGGGAS